MRRARFRNLSFVLIFTLPIGMALGITEGNVGMSIRFSLWVFLVSYLIPILVVRRIKLKFKGIEVVVFYITMAISGLLLAKPFGMSLGDIRPIVYGAVFGALFGALLYSGGFNKLEKFIDEKLQPNIKVRY